MWGLETDHSFHEHIIRNVSVVPLLSTSFHTWSDSFPGFGLFLVIATYKKLIFMVIVT